MVFIIRLSSGCNFFSYFHCPCCKSWFALIYRTCWAGAKADRDIWLSQMNKSSTKTSNGVARRRFRNDLTLLDNLYTLTDNLYCNHSFCTLHFQCVLAVDNQLYHIFMSLDRITLFGFALNKTDRAINLSLLHFVHALEWCIELILDYISWYQISRLNPYIRQSKCHVFNY